LQIKTKIVSCHTTDSKPVKQEVNSTVILPPLVYPAYGLTCFFVEGNEKPIMVNFRVRQMNIIRY
jgi:hypothetical protein